MRGNDRVTMRENEAVDNGKFMADAASALKNARPDRLS
jgi:hypothetical protein